MYDALAMIDLKTALLSRILTRVVERVQAGSDADQAWNEAREALDATEENDAEVRAAVDSRDVEALHSIVEQWSSGDRVLPEQDRAVFKRAMKAYRKRLKLTRLDEESKMGVGAMSGGRKSGVVGIKPPNQYPREVWEELVRQGRLVDAGLGTYELPPA